MTRTSYFAKKWTGMFIFYRISAVGPICLAKVVFNSETICTLYLSKIRQHTQSMEILKCTIVILIKSKPKSVLILIPLHFRSVWLPTCQWKDHCNFDLEKLARPSTKPTSFCRKMNYDISPQFINLRYTYSYKRCQLWRDWERFGTRYRVRDDEIWLGCWQRCSHNWAIAAEGHLLHKLESTVWDLVGIRTRLLP